MPKWTDHNKFFHARMTESQLVCMLQMYELKLQYSSDLIRAKENILSVKLALEEKGVVLHHHHCSCCGTRLVEAGLGILHCLKCITDFIPTCNTEESKLSLSWKDSE